jgi:MFS family permease
VFLGRPKGRRHHSHTSLLRHIVFLSFLDQTIVSAALPVISAYFDSGRSSSFVGSAYLLTSTAMQPIWGRLSDVFGRKVTLLACVVVFIIGSLACAVAQTMIQLIVFRGMQGFGGGGLITLTLIIISDVVSLRDRGKYQGVTEITIAIANGGGPLLGGVMAEKISWRWFFWINLPIGGFCLAVIVFFLPLKPVHGSIKEWVARSFPSSSRAPCTLALLALMFRRLLQKTTEDRLWRRVIDHRSERPHHPPSQLGRNVVPLGLRSGVGVPTVQYRRLRPLLLLGMEIRKDPGRAA